MNLNPGLKELVAEVAKGESFSKAQFPKNTAEIWDQFSFFVFLGHKRSNAEANYLYETLYSKGLLRMSGVLRVRLRWSESVKDYANTLLATTPSPRKSAALRSLLYGLDDAQRSILEGALYFKRNNVTPSFLLNRTRTIQDVDSLLNEWCWPHYAVNSNHIWSFGLTKSILMLNGMGLALDHCPPSWQVLKFVEEDLRTPVSPMLYQDEPPAVEWTNAYVAIGKVRQVATQIALEVKGVTTADVGNALWYWKSSQSLLSRMPRLRRKLSPAVILEFLGKKRRKLEDLARDLSDINQIDQLTSELRGYVINQP